MSREVTTLDNITYITVETVMDFLHKAKDKYKDKPIVTIMDNARYQHCSMVMNKPQEFKYQNSVSTSLFPKSEHY